MEAENHSRNWSHRRSYRLQDPPVGGSNYASPDKSGQWVCDVEIHNRKNQTPIQKILQHLGIWETQQRPPPKNDGFLSPDGTDGGGVLRLGPRPEKMNGAYPENCC